MSIHHIPVTFSICFLLILNHFIPASCEGQDRLAFSDTIWLDDLVIVGRRSETTLGDRPGTPGWNVFDLRFSYEIAEFRINTGMLNLLNEAYRTHGSGVDNMGRSIYVSLLYNFSFRTVRGNPNFQSS